jgi:hypothetical protein
MSFFKRFSFFAQRDAHDHGVPTNTTCVACARGGPAGGLGHSYLGTDAGAVVVLAPPPPSSSAAPSASAPSSSGGLSALGTFVAHGHRVLQIAYADRLDQIVTLGLEEPGVSSATVKVWDAARLRQRATAAAATTATATPPVVSLPPLRVQRVFSASSKRPESEATCLAATELVAPLLTVAVGLANGGVYVFQGDTRGGGAAPVPAAGTSSSAAAAAAAAASGLPSPRQPAGGASSSAAPGGPTAASSSSSSGPPQGMQCVAKLTARPDAGDLWAVTRMFFAMAAPPYQQRQDQFRLLYEEHQKRAAAGLAGGAAAAAATTTTAAPPPAATTTTTPQQPSRQRPDLLRVDASALWSGVPVGVGSLVADDGPRANALAELQERLHLYVATESQTLCFRVQDGSRSVLEPRGLAVNAAAAATLRPAEPRGGGGGGGGSGGDDDPAAAAAVAAAAASAPPLLVVGRDDALYDYTLDTRAGCTVFAGRKMWLSTALGRYLVLVTAAGGRGGGGAGAAGAAAASRGRSAAAAAAAADDHNDDDDGPGAASATQACTLTFLDVRHKLIAGSFVLPSLVRHVLAPTGGSAPATTSPSTTQAATTSSSSTSPPPPALAVVLASGRAVAFYERPAADRVDALLGRAMHRTALEVARSGGADAGALAAIRRAWGDHLYARGDFDAAMAQYLECPPPWLEASYVVRRFLDAQRVALLARYLGSLHKRGLAGPDHTTLLLSCYAKLKDVAGLDAFVHQQEQGPAAAAGGASASAAAADDVASLPRPPAPPSSPLPPAGPLPFDAETAFRVLRGAGYYEHALAVARRAGNRVDWALSVLLEDLAAHDRALEFVEALPRRARAEALRRYGRPLVAARLENATRLLMDLCVAPPGVGGGGAGQYVASVADFAHLFADRPVALTLLCEYVLNSAPGADGAGPAPPPGAVAVGGGGGAGPGSSQQQQQQQQLQGDSSLRALYHTLLELYLSDDLQQEEEEDGARLGGRGGASGSSTTTEADKQQQQQRQAAAIARRRDKARELLARGWQPHMLHAPAYDPQHALALCRLRAFAPGLVFLYDRLRLPRELLRVHMAANDYGAVVAACAEHGDPSRGGDPQLWADALDYLCSSSGSGKEEGVVAGETSTEPSASAPSPSSCPPEAVVREVLRRIEQARALSPLAVLQALARHPTLPVSLVRDYVARELERDARLAETDRAAVARLAAETAALRAEAQRLRTRPRVFQNSRCAASGAPLELPVAHFMCGHSFNLRSLGDGDRECPLCAPELARALDVRRHLRRGAGEQDAFFRALREAPDGGFGVVAEHFGRGLMNCTAAAARDV